ncbi:two component Fis family sigma54-specific transcriptional regulator [Babesia ovis]|uniref:Two component Fis family sigma54-specific transcriptional regulator n=1 Tax=Babesia ovis TaxID=5869 RepID=A0A9W5TDZ3_BABOV|nr:two component Fis family sigma54-specific transcriptional regulator [Babesia ovis]
MEGRDSDETCWDSSPLLADLAWFCCLNRKLIAEWPPVYVVTFYFILHNLYNVHLRDIREYALVTSPIFASFFASPLDGRIHIDSSASEPTPGFDVDSGITSLLEHENMLLNAAQKQIIREMLVSDPDVKVPGWLRFHIYVGKVDARLHLVHCNCCAYDFCGVLVELLENYDRFLRRPESKMSQRRRVPSVIHQIIQHAPSIVELPSVEVFPTQRIDHLWGTRSLFTAGMIHERCPKDSYRHIVVASSIMLLYILMPHHYANKHLARVTKRCDHRSLIELNAIVDRLLFNFPKEGDVWSLKLYITKEFFRRLHTRDWFTSIESILGKGRMDIEHLMLEISSKAQMNGRLSWYLWHMYVAVRDKALRCVPSRCTKRVLERIESYFIRLYAVLLIANDGYQGIFYIYLHLVRDHPGNLKGLREICEHACPNASWQSNLEILDKTT